MPDDNQSSTTPSATDSQGVDQTAEQAANEALEQSGGLNIDMPDLNDVEYATPSAYIDPDLPSTPTSIDNPDEPTEEKPEENLDILEMTPEQIAEAIKASNAVMAKVAEKVANSRNILIATSSDPSVDELAAAISLSMFLDRLGKHAIAIYSGKTPDALAFLSPEKTFETDADVLQDFVISISKEKADHLRYRLDGDFVKIFITPYKDKIVSEDLEFSYGDYNIDLVLALNVDNGVDLDAALREHGRIMHDATVVNITTGNPGKFGEIEWNNKHASSISEMISELLLNASGDTQLNAEEATALLTGIVAATDRFAKANTFPTTMQTASRLLEAGADQQLVAENIHDDLDNQFYTFSEAAAKAKKSTEESENGEVENFDFSFTPTEEPKETIDPNDETALKISHGDEEPKNEEPESDESKDDEPKNEEKDEDSKDDEKTNTPEEPDSNEPDSALLNELKATETSLSSEPSLTDSNPAAAATPTVPETPAASEEPSAMPEMNFNAPLTPESSATPESPSAMPEINFGAPTDVTSKYSQMLEDALNEPAAGEAAPMGSSLPPAEPAAPVPNMSEPNPAAITAPNVADTPEANTLPEINYGQTSEVLPPPPAPPVDLSSPMPMPVPSEPATTEPAATEPAAPAPAVEAPATNSPDTFTIPGI